ncbi:MAG: hypothetical protein OIF50_00700 [Flavobacteriaceae bacterium]|nr:hypothetical protein [Flavobacteriaceae bacterium]
MKYFQLTSTNATKTHWHKLLAKFRIYAIVFLSGCIPVGFLFAFLLTSYEYAHDKEFSLLGFTLRFVAFGSAMGAYKLSNHFKYKKK